MRHQLLMRGAFKGVARAADAVEQQHGPAARGQGGFAVGDEWLGRGARARESADAQHLDRRGIVDLGNAGAGGEVALQYRSVVRSLVGLGANGQCTAGMSKRAVGIRANVLIEPVGGIGASSAISR